MDLMNKGWLEDVAAEFDKSKELTRFLDACVIKLEGGTDQDIKKLLDGIDETEEPIEIKEIVIKSLDFFVYYFFFKKGVLILIQKF